MAGTSVAAVADLVNFDDSGSPNWGTLALLIVRRVWAAVFGTRRALRDVALFDASIQALLVATILYYVVSDNLSVSTHRRVQCDVGMCGCGRLAGGN